MILGRDADRFEFVSDHVGKSPRELRLVGGDGEGGLVGGEEPEREPLAVRFLGSDRPGDFSATVRIVTQAAIVGRLSRGGRRRAAAPALLRRYPRFRDGGGRHEA